MKSNTKFKVKYSDFTINNNTNKLFEYLADIVKLEHLLNVGLISRIEYEKVKCEIEKNIDLIKY